MQSCNKDHESLFPVQVNKPTQAMPLLLQPPPSLSLPAPLSLPCRCCCCGGDSWEQPSRQFNESKSRPQLPALLPAHHRLLERLSRAIWQPASALDLSTLDRLEVETGQVWFLPPTRFPTDEYYSISISQFVLTLQWIMLNAVLPRCPKLQALSNLQKVKTKAFAFFLSISGFPPYSDLELQCVFLFQGGAIGNSKPSMWPRGGIWTGAEHSLKQTVNLSSLTLKPLLCLCQVEFSRVAVSNASEGNCRLGVGTVLLSEHSSYLPLMLMLQSRLICCERSLSPCLS